MKWLKITVGFFLVTLVKCGPTRSEVDDGPAGLNIKKIERTAKRTKQKEDTFKFTLEGTPTKPVQKYLLEVFSGGVPEDPVASDDPLEKQSLSFTTNLDSYYGQKANFLITGWVDEKTIGAYADVEVANFPNFPKVTDIKSFDDPRKTVDGRLIRLTGSLGDMKLKDTESLIDGPISYLSSLTSSLTDYVPCNDDSGISVCDVKLDDNPTTTSDVPIMSSVLLSYMENNKATITFATSNKNALISSEVILMTSSQEAMSSQENVLCILKDPETTCEIDWTAPSSATLPMIIIQNTDDSTDETWVTKSIEVHDRELIITKLGDTIIEGRWNMLDTEIDKPDVLYQLTVSKKDPKTDLSIDVDCSHLLPTKLCFGYFPNLDAGDYTLTVAQKASGLMDQIESLPIELTAQPEMKIISQHTIEHHHPQKANVKTCFRHLTPITERFFSHYEMLIINGKGQWLKHTLMEEVEEGKTSEGSLCFAPFTINTKDFDLTEGTKVVISQRGVDGVTVLASGESTLF